MGQAAPFWRFSVESYPDLEVIRPTLSTAMKTSNGESKESSQVGRVILIIHKKIHVLSIATTLFSYILAWSIVLFELFSCIQQKSTCVTEYSLPLLLERLFFSDLVLMGIVVHFIKICPKYFVFRSEFTRYAIYI
jgi:hypothetical protein